MRAADAVVNVSTHEGFPLTLLEAMALGVPVAAFSNGGPAEMIEHGVSGLLVPSDDSRLLTNQLDVLLRDADLRRRLGGGAFARHRDLFTSEAMAETFQRRLEDLLAASKPVVYAR
jgi:glycosyltransferase involved in cell wall biosynthesis